MAKRLPPLDWVRVFEVAARTGSFAVAAEALSVSAGAVSRTVKELEKFLGIKLFRRLPRGVELTAIGADYARRVTPAIRRIAEASANISRQKRARTLRVTAMPALGERWLVPRLGKFRDEFPDISVEVSADAAVIDLADSDFDLALRYGDGRFGNLEAVRLFPDEIYPVMAPIVARKYRIGEFKDIFRVPRLQDTYWASDWQLWLDAAGVVAPADWHQTSFTLYNMALSAAAAGQGVVMGHHVLVESDLREGRLVEPFDLRVKVPKGFYCVENPNRPRSEAVRAFVDWLARLAVSD